MANVRKSAYGYADSNPVKFTDPEGLETEILRSAGGIPHVAYRVYDEANGPRVHDVVYTFDRFGFRRMSYEEFTATHNIVEDVPLHTTPAEDKAFRDYWARNKEIDYAFLLGDDCATLTAGAINAVRPREPAVISQPFPYPLTWWLQRHPFPTGFSGGYQAPPGPFSQSCGSLPISPTPAEGPACASSLRIR